MTKLILHNAPIEYDFITGLSRLRTPFGTTATLSRISRFDGFNHNDCDLRAKIQDDRVVFFCRHGLSKLFGKKSERELAKRLLHGATEDKNLTNLVASSQKYIRSKVFFDHWYASPSIQGYRYEDSGRSKRVAIVPDPPPEIKPLERVPSYSYLKEQLGISSTDAPETKLPDLNIEREEQRDDILAPSEINGYRFYDRTTYEKGEHPNRTKSNFKPAVPITAQEVADENNIKTKHTHKYVCEFEHRAKNIYDYCKEMKSLGHGEDYLYIINKPLIGTPYHTDLLHLSVSRRFSPPKPDSMTPFRMVNWICGEKSRITCNTIVSMGIERINQIVPEMGCEETDKGRRFLHGNSSTTINTSGTR